MSLIVKNGCVHGLLNRIDGERMDICVKDGKIAEKADEPASKKKDNGKDQQTSPAEKPTAQHQPRIQPLRIAVATRAGTAKALGLKQKGHLGVGADADIAVYDLNVEQVDLAKKPKTVRRAFETSAYTVKGGEIVARNGDILKSVEGRTFWVDVKLSSNPSAVASDLKKRFREYWTVEYENYPVPEDYLTVSSPVSVKAEV